MHKLALSNRLLIGSKPKILREASLLSTNRSAASMQNHVKAAYQHLCLQAAQRQLHKTIHALLRSNFYPQTTFKSLSGTHKLYNLSSWLHGSLFAHHLEISPLPRLDLWLTLHMAGT